MREPQKKGIKDIFKKIKESVSGAERTFHGNLGREALDTADKLGTKLPKALQPEEYSPDDMAKAMKAWKEQGMGKIGNQPNFGKGYRNPDYYTSDHLSKMTKGNRDYITKSDDPYTMMKYGEMAKKISKQNFVEMRPSPSKGEIAAGRAITTGGILGTGAAKAHSYWTNKKNEKK
jgi:hypothetical protein